MDEEAQRLIEQDSFSRRGRLLPVDWSTVNGRDPIQEKPDVFHNSSRYPHLLCKHGQIALRVASSRHSPVYLAVRIDIGRFDSRVYAHDGLLAMLCVATFLGIPTTAIERGGYGFEVDGYGYGNEGRLRRGGCADKDWETARLQWWRNRVAHFVDYESD